MFFLCRGRQETKLSQVALCLKEQKDHTVQQKCYNHYVPLHRRWMSWRRVYSIGSTSSRPAFAGGLMNNLEQLKRGDIGCSSQRNFTDIGSASHCFEHGSGDSEFEYMTASWRQSQLLLQLVDAHRADLFRLPSAAFGGGGRSQTPRAAS